MLRHNALENPKAFFDDIKERRGVETATKGMTTDWFKGSVPLACSPTAWRRRWKLAGSQFEGFFTDLQAEVHELEIAKTIEKIHAIAKEHGGTATIYRADHIKPSVAKASPWAIRKPSKRTTRFNRKP